MSEPILMLPAFRSGRETPWAGDMLHRKYEKYALGNLIGESYDLSLLSDHESTAPDGTPLSECVKTSELPFMIRWLDAKSPMSIHVHPHHDEHLIVTDTGAEARIVAGLQAHVAIDDLEDLLANSPPEDVFHFVSVHPGDVISIPAGVPHSLMDITCYQIQAPLTDSFRLYDWDRTNARGQKRPLQFEKAVSCLTKKTASCTASQDSRVIHAYAFDVFRFCDQSNIKYQLIQPFSVLTFLAPGQITLETGKKLYLCAGQTVFIPGDSIPFSLTGAHFVLAVPCV